SALVTPAAALPVREAFIDGEIVVLEKDGSSNFQALQEALSEKTNGRLIYYVFDILHLDGYDLRPLPLVQRKEVLAESLTTAKNAPIRFSDHVTGRAEDFFQRACQTGLEGIISKRKDSPYKPGRARD